jgi:hypothetical protein
MNDVRTHTSAFHIHLDLERISEEFKAFLLSNGFYYDPFDKQEGDSNSVPEHHYTRKFNIFEKKEFQNVCKTLSKRGLEDQHIKGYLEGEIVSMFPISFKPYTYPSHSPFYIHTRQLHGPPYEPFREVEFHARLHAADSHPQLIELLKEDVTGLYNTHRRKGRESYLLLTAQGHKKDINPLMLQLQEYLIRSGGAVSARIVKETIAFYALFGGADHRDLPKIVDRIEQGRKKE